MARRWHEPATRGERILRNIAFVAPGVVAVLGVALTAEEVFSRDTFTGLVLAGLFVAGAAAAWGARRFAPPQVVAPVPDPASRAVDVETGLGNHRLLLTLLRAEVARSQRYGYRSALTVAEIAPMGFRPIDPAERPPSPARWVAEALLGCVRQGDIVVRLDERRFAVLLMECNAAGAEQIEHRILDELTRRPYARNDDGSAIFLKARVHSTVYGQDVTSAEQYLELATEGLQEAPTRSMNGLRERVAS